MPSVVESLSFVNNKTHKQDMYQRFILRIVRTAVGWVMLDNF